MNNIEQSVLSAQDYVEQAKENTKAATKLQKGSKRKMILIGVCIAISLTILIISLAVGLS